MSSSEEVKQQPQTSLEKNSSAIHFVVHLDAHVYILTIHNHSFHPHTDSERLRRDLDVIKNIEVNI